LVRVFVASGRLYLNTVAAAPGAAATLEKTLSGTQPPQTDAEREAFEKKVLTLIRLHAVKMVGQHRSELVARKKQFEDMPAAPEQHTGDAAGTPNPRKADLVKAIHAAARPSPDARRPRACETAVAVSAERASEPGHLLELRTCNYGSQTGVQLRCQNVSPVADGLEPGG
jgi:hypothetical protein